MSTEGLAVVIKAASPTSLSGTFCVFGLGFGLVCLGSF